MEMLASLVTICGLQHHALSNFIHDDIKNNKKKKKNSKSNLKSKSLKTRKNNTLKVITLKLSVIVQNKYFTSDYS